MSNPIPFNPDTMSVRAVKDCTEALRDLYDLFERLEASDTLSPDEINERVTDSVRTSLRFFRERGL